MKGKLSIFDTLPSWNAVYYGLVAFTDDTALKMLFCDLKLSQFYNFCMSLALYWNQGVQN